MKKYGGNEVTNNFRIKYGENLIEQNKKYFYKIFKLKKNSTIKVPEFCHGTIFIKSVKKATLIFNKKRIKVRNGFSIEFKNYKNFEIECEFAIFFLVGLVKKNSDKRFVKKTIYHQHYKVKKPWGYELWINGQKPTYAFKEIFLKKGNQTSLQYHNRKRETNFLYEGKAKLIYKKNKNIKNNDVKNNDLASINIKNISIINVKPKDLHRIKALTDIRLYETSTPDLDDVIRIMDDTKRKDGRIQYEHKK